MVPLEPKDRTSRSSIVIIIITERSENAPSNHSNSPHRISLLRKAGTPGAHGHRRRKQAEPSCRSAAQGMRRFRLPSELPNRQFLCSNVPINLIFKCSYTIWKLWGKRPGASFHFMQKLCKSHVVINRIYCNIVRCRHKFFSGPITLNAVILIYCNILWYNKLKLLEFPIYCNKMIQ